MTKFVIEIDVMVPKWEKQLRRYSLDEQTTERLMADLTPAHNDIVKDVTELRDLLTNTGETSTATILGRREDDVKRFLKALGKSAWKAAVPWEVDETEFSYTGDEKFFDYKRAYVISNEEFEFSKKAMQ